MATFRAYAKVLEPDDPTMRIYQAGLRACPGEPGCRSRRCCGEAVASTRPPPR